MPSPPSSQIFLCLSFILFLDTTMSEKYEAGKSWAKSCLAPSNRDFRELSFYKGTSRLFTIWISSDTLSNTLEVSGAYNDFTWISNEGRRETYPCTNANSERSDIRSCRGPESTGNKIYLSDGEKDMASLSIDSNYKSRIWLSGTILNAEIILIDLVKEDEGCYSCRWEEFNVPDLFRGPDHCLDIVTSKRYEAGKYATISCLAPSNRGFRSLTFFKVTSRLFTIWIVNDKISNTLEVNGTYNDFTWILNQDGRKPYPCTNANSERSATPGCRGPESTGNKIYLSDGEKDMASLSIDSNYKSRIRLFGTILNPTIIVSNLVKEDEGCYTCTWEELDVPGLYRGPNHCFDIAMSERYEAGKSATISCLAPSNRRFRELSFYKGTSSLFTIWLVSDKYCNTMEVNGTYNDFTWILNQDGRKPYPCTNANSQGSATRGCRGPEGTDTKIYLSEGKEDMASLSIDSNYKSRIRLSGTIMNAKIILSDLVKEDEGCYSCRWEEYRVPRLFVGPENCLDIGYGDAFIFGAYIGGPFPAPPM
ncbi:uncharacterized protein [Aquarana catesbeiana]|uniref:uncharacterized protein n=1 Tax=Aquarana catesbeiana TaxID=8400 RepID=UPI003CCA2C00